MKIESAITIISSCALTKAYGFNNNQLPQKPIKYQQNKIQRPSIEPSSSNLYSHPHGNCDKDKNIEVDSKRRESLRLFFQSSLFGITALSSFPRHNEAACLPGDTSVDCIGCYKVPIDEAIKHMIDTPEQLAKFAPDLRWTPPVEYPKNYKAAKDEILDLKNNVRALSPLISKGELTSAGVEILRIVPRITVAGRFIIGTLNDISDFSMKALRTETAHNELLASLGAADVMIGQSVAGQFGSVTVAQIQILEELRFANEHFEELVKALPEGYSG